MAQSMTASARRDGDEIYSVRDATLDDVDRLADIKVRGWAGTYAPLVPPDVLAPFLDRVEQARRLGRLIGAPGTLLLVAGVGDEARAGFALTFMDRRPEPKMESLHVLREHRGSGIG